MEPTPSLLYRFGGRFELDSARRLLLADGEPQHLSPKVYSVLLELVRARGGIVTKSELLERVWGETYVEEGSVPRAVSTLRRALGDAGTIVTAARVGYRLAVPVDVAHSDATSLSAAAGANLSGTSRSAPFVGRHAELAFLMEAFRSAVEGRGGIVAVSGEPGLGKSRLVDQCLAQLSADAVPPAVGRGGSREHLAGTAPYSPMLEALEFLAANGGTSEAVLRMRRVAPTWFRMLERGGAPEPSSGSGFELRLRAELGRLLQQLSAERPIVLFFDDWHWVDPSTVDLLAHLEGELGRSRILCVVAYRSSDLMLGDHPFARLKSDLESRGRLRELALDLLDPEATRDYVNFTFSGHVFPPEFPSFLHGRTGGHPLFLADLVDYMRRVGMIQADNGRWTLKQHPAEYALPESMRALIDRKLGCLDPDQRTVLEAASIQGLEWESAVIREVINLPDDRVERALHDLEHRHFLLRPAEARSQGRGTPRYAFAHALYLQAVFSGIGAGRKSRWSRATADALLRGHEGRAETLAAQLASLLEQAGEIPRALAWYRQAAQSASRTAAYDEAIALGRRGLRLLDRHALPDAREQQVALLVTLAETHLHLRTSDGMAQSVEYARRAARLAPACGHAQALLAQGLLLRASHALSPPDDDVLEARDATMRALKIDERMPQAHTALGYVRLLGEWDWDGSRVAFEAAAACQRRYAPAYLGLAFSHVAMGQPARALEIAEHALALDSYSLIIRSQVGWMLYFCRRYREAVAHLIATKDLEPRFWRPYFNLGFCYVQLKQHEDAVRVLEQASMLNSNATTHAALAHAYAAAGHHQRARRILDTLGQAGYVSFYWIALIHAALGEPGRALDCLERAVRGRECPLFVLGSEPAFETLRREPRWAALMEAMRPGAFADGASTDTRRRAAHPINP